MDSHPRVRQRLFLAATVLWVAAFVYAAVALIRDGEAHWLFHLAIGGAAVLTLTAWTARFAVPLNEAWRMGYVQGLRKGAKANRHMRRTDDPVVLPLPREVRGGAEASPR